MKLKIEWDLDGLSPAEAGVPEIVTLPEELPINEHVSDYLSETYGWCVLGWVVIKEEATEDGARRLLTEKVKDRLVGRTIIDAWYQKAHVCSEYCIVLLLDDGNVLYPSSGDKGTSAGTLSTSYDSIRKITKHS